MNNQDSNNKIENINKILNSSGQYNLNSTVCRTVYGRKLNTEPTKEAKKSRIKWTLLESFVMSVILNIILLAYYSSPIILPNLTNNPTLDAFIRVIVRLLVFFILFSAINIYITEKTVENFNKNNK